MEQDLQRLKELQKEVRLIQDRLVAKWDDENMIAYAARQAYEEAYEEGRQEARMLIASRLKAVGYSNEKVSEWLSVPLSEAEKL